MAISQTRRLPPQEEHSFPISFSLSPKPFVHSETGCPGPYGESDAESESLT
ncbi:hypothetical protein AVEN_245784-1, partial [Araneus ventricosus]